MDGSERSDGRGDLELSIVIPVYNEGQNIASTLRGIASSVRSAATEILVVYDFDEDDTIPVVTRLQGQIPHLKLHRNRRGRGVLNAIQAGFEFDDVKQYYLEGQPKFAGFVTKGVARAAA